MKRLAAALAVLLAVGFSSCQCSDKPPVPPTEDDQAQVLSPGSTAEMKAVRA